MKLIATYLMGNCEQFVDLTLEAIHEHVDKIIIIYDTSSKDKTFDEIYQFVHEHGSYEIIKNFLEPKAKYDSDKKFTIIEREYQHDYKVKSANSDARNFYLDYLKQNHLGDWCLVVDADEIPDESIAQLKVGLEKLDQTKNYLISPKMIHFIQDLGHEDSTQPKHYVPNRLFKIHKELFYPTGEHPVLHSLDARCHGGVTDSPVIYHLAYCREMFYIKERYLNHLNKSEIHTGDFMKHWYLSHLSGQYPKSELDLRTLPKTIRDFFLIDEALK